MARSYAILAGLNHEMRPLLRRFGRVTRIQRDNVRFSVGRRLGIEWVGAVSGVGEERAAGAAEIAVGAFHPSGVISAGFSGSLRKEIEVGGLVLADQVMTSDDGGRAVIRCDDRLLDAARGAALRSGSKVFVGPIVCARAVLVTAEAKRETGRKTGALAVDMESAGAGRVASRAGVPFLAVRAVSDPEDADFGFDPANWIAPDGSLRVLHGIGSVCRDPKSISGLIRMGASSRRAARALAMFLAQFIQILGEENARDRDNAVPA